MKKAYFNWSSGKDSSLALYHAIQSGIFDIKTLFTVVKMDSGRISMHEISTDLLQKQADAIGIPLTTFQLDVAGMPQQYESAMQRQIKQFKNQNIETALFGDLYLEELRKRREQNCNMAGMTAAFPLWNIPQKDIMSEFIQLGFKAIITCVDHSVLSEHFVGRVIDEAFLSELPENVDICGENGEYHSFVFDGPIFKHPVQFEVKRKYYVDYPNSETQN